MTYWAREHEHNLRRIGDIMRELEHAYEDIIPALINDLEEDGAAETETSREYLRDTRTRIALAMSSLGIARDRLPAPQYRPTVHPTAAEVIEREG